MVDAEDRAKVQKRRRGRGLPVCTPVIFWLTSSAKRAASVLVISTWSTSLSRARTARGMRSVYDEAAGKGLVVGRVVDPAPDEAVRILAGAVVADLRVVSGLVFGVKGVDRRPDKREEGGGENRAANSAWLRVRRRYFVDRSRSFSFQLPYSLAMPRSEAKSSVPGLLFSVRPASSARAWEGDRPRSCAERRRSSHWSPAV